MNKKHGKPELSGKIGGLAVKGMIEAVEEKMAAGEQISAAPSNTIEAEHLKQVKKENRQSGLWKNN